jgi:excinuclease ABC subunit A
LLDALRPLYAALPLSRQRGYTAARFSLNTRGGRCERCGGTGQLQVDMNFLADLYTPCDACHGARYNRETLEVTWRGKSIAQALALSVDVALEFFAPIPAAAGILQAMHDIGLGYLPLDRSVTTLSGGEAQRVKIATYLAKAAPKRGRREGERLLFVLDEPSTGLHFREVDMLLRALYRLRSAGHTVLCIEHHQGILSRADYLIELGPGAGEDGGQIVYAGVPQYSF